MTGPGPTSLEIAAARRRRSSCAAVRVAWARRRHGRGRARAAGRLGGKVLVLTIDPAKRLADALGLEALGNNARRVPDRGFSRQGLEPRGELWAPMLDTKPTLDEARARHAPDEATRVPHPRQPLLPRTSPARFVRSQDYMAMERLFELHATGEFDLIVIDTPPTRNALDFLDAPERMAEFFGGRLLRWLTMPYRVGGGRGARMINVASRPFYQMADRMLGSQFLQDIAEFFLNFQSMYAGLHRAGRGRRAAPARPARTTFAVVTTLGVGAAARGGVLLRPADAAQTTTWARSILNRTLPRYLLSTRRRSSRGRSSGRTPGGCSATLADVEVPAPRRSRATAPGAHGRSVSRSATSAVVATREAELRAELARCPRSSPTCPRSTSDIGDISGLVALGDALFREG